MAIFFGKKMGQERGAPHWDWKFPARSCPFCVVLLYYTILHKEQLHCKKWRSFLKKSRAKKGDLLTGTQSSQRGAPPICSVLLHYTALHKKQLHFKKWHSFSGKKSGKKEELLTGTRNSQRRVPLLCRFIVLHYITQRAIAEQKMAIFFEKVGPKKGGAAHWDPKVPARSSTYLSGFIVLHCITQRTIALQKLSTFFNRKSRAKKGDLLTGTRRSQRGAPLFVRFYCITLHYTKGKCTAKNGNLFRKKDGPRKEGSSLGLEVPSEELPLLCRFIVLHYITQRAIALQKMAIFFGVGQERGAPHWDSKFPAKSSPFVSFYCITLYYTKSNCTAKNGNLLLKKSRAKKVEFLTGTQRSQRRAPPICAVLLHYTALHKKQLHFKKWHSFSGKKIGPRKSELLTGTRNSQRRVPLLCRFIVLHYITQRAIALQKMAIFF